MKFNFCQKRVGSLLALLMFSSFLLNATNEPTKSNWSNSMEIIQTNSEPGNETVLPCIRLGEENNLYFTLYVQTKEKNVESFYPMKFWYKYYVNDNLVESGEEPVVLSSMFRYIPNLGIYVASFNRVYSCVPPCKGYDNFFRFRLEYQLVRADISGPGGSYVGYPIGQCPALWPPSHFNIPEPHESYVAPVHVESKWICCSSYAPIVAQPNNDMADNSMAHPNFQPTYYSNGDGQQEPLPSSIQANGELTVTPNPFSDRMTVNFSTDQPGTVVLKCMDMKGGLVKEFSAYCETAGTQSSNFDLTTIPPGLYYLCLYTNTGRQIVKIVKT